MDQEGSQKIRIAQSRAARDRVTVAVRTWRSAVSRKNSVSGGEAPVNRARLGVVAKKAFRRESGMGRRSRLPQSRGDSAVTSMAPHGTLGAMITLVTAILG